MALSQNSLDEDSAARRGASEVPNHAGERRSHIDMSRLFGLHVDRLPPVANGLIVTVLGLEFSVRVPR
jgi:hypothetical protein